MKIQDEGIDIEYRESFLPLEISNTLFQVLRKEIPWEQKSIWTPRGKIPMPRMVSWHADNPSLTYKYSGVLHQANPWTEFLLKLKKHVEKELGTVFNGALCNLYENEKHSVSPHADDEPEMEENAMIASISLGSVRKFIIKHNENKNRYVIPLGHGSLIVMKGLTQKVSLHSIPKSKEVCEGRINITFRKSKL